jgi:opacity protein-like surface antigen
MHQRFANCVLFLLGHLVAPVASADTYGSGWYRELQVAVAVEDNVSRSFNPADQFRDTATSLGAGLGYSQNVGEHLRYVLSGYLTLRRQDEFRGLNHIAAALGTEITWQPNSGLEHPWYVSTVDLTHLNYSGSRAREGTLLNAAVSVNRRFGMRTTARLGYRYLDLLFLGKSAIEKQEDAAFDVARHELFVSADYQLAEHIHLVGGYAFQRGDLTSSVSKGSTGVSYDFYTLDPVFQSCSTRPCWPFHAYRPRADVDTWDLGLAFTVAGIDYDLSGRYIAARGDSGKEYPNWIAQFGFIWTF